MAYVPPHKRRSLNDSTTDEGSLQSPPKPELLRRPLLSKKNHNKLESSGTSSATTAQNQQQQQQEDMDSESDDDTYFRWFAVGLDDDDQHFPSSLHLRTVFVRNDGKIQKRQALTNTITDLAEQSRKSFTRTPWEYIAENVLQGLLSSFENLRNEMESRNLAILKPVIAARIGKVLFYGRPSVNNQESVTTANLLSDDTLRPLRGSFYTNITDSYVEYLIKEGASKGGLEFKHEKEVYLVFVLDAIRPDNDIICKCRVLKENGKLQLYKLRHTYAGQMRRDISCLEKNLDMRLDLYDKRNLNVLTDDDMKNIKDLISSSIVDTQAKGGLRWPLGKDVSRDRFEVHSVWHKTAKTYKNSSLKLKIKDVDRYKFMSATGQATREVVIMLTVLASQLLKQQVDMNLINEMLKDDLKNLWNNFLCCERFPP